MNQNFVKSSVSSGSDFLHYGSLNHGVIFYIMEMEALIVHFFVVKNYTDVVTGQLNPITGKS